MKLYKVIKENKAKDGGKFDYSKYLPKNGKKGKWTPTIKNLKKCETGYHVIPYWIMWWTEGAKVYEVEAKGIEKETEIGVIDKYVCKSIRMIKEFVPVFKDNENTGDWNTGDWNTGNRNTGNRNTGDSNTGDWNTGDWNTGDRNTGDRNTGDWNTGNSNTGDRNTGDRNTGDWNTGNSNTGDWNTGDSNTGYLNTTLPPVRIFNKDTDVKVEDIKFPSFFYFDIIEVIDAKDMTKSEKGEYPKYQAKTFVRELKYKDAWKKSFSNATKEDVKKLLELPNFEYKVFEEITGITKRMINSKMR